MADESLTYLAGYLAELGDRRGRHFSRTDLERLGLAGPDGLTLAGALVCEAIRCAPELARGAALAAIQGVAGRGVLRVVGEDRAKLSGPVSRLEPLLDVGDADGLRALGVDFLEGPSSRSLTFGLAALACASAAECKVESWRRHARLALAFEAVAFGRLAWREVGLCSGFEAAAMRLMPWRDLRAEDCSKAAEREGGSPFERWRVLGSLNWLRRAMGDPARVARAAARLVLSAIDDDLERAAWLGGLSTEGQVSVSRMGASDWLTGSRSPQIERSEWQGLAALVAVAASEALSTRGRLTPMYQKAAAWRAALLVDAVQLARGVTHSDGWADVVRVAACDCSADGFEGDCPRAARCPAGRAAKRGEAAR